MEIIPKPIEKPPLWQEILVYLSISLLVGALIGYLFLMRVEKKLKASLQDLKEQISEARTQEIIDLEKEILSYERKINHFAEIFNQHKLNSKFFEFLEKKTYPKVFFSKLELNPQDSKAILFGQTESFSSLGYQVQILEKEPLVKGINLSKVSIGKNGGVEFALEIDFEPKMISW